MNIDSDKDLDKLAKAAGGEGSPKPKGKKASGKQVTFDLTKFPDGIDPDAMLEFDMSSVPSLEALRVLLKNQLETNSAGKSADTVQSFKELVGTVMHLASQAIMSARAKGAQRLAVKLAQAADRDPAAAASPEKLGSIKEALKSPSKKEPELTERLVSVLEGATANGAWDIQDLKKGMENIFMSMKPSLLKHRESFTRVFTQILLKLNNAIQSAKTAGKYKEAYELANLARDLQQQYKEQYEPLCKALGHTKTVSLFLSKANPFSAINDAQWAMITGLAGKSNSEYKTALEAILPSLPAATKKKPAPKRSSPSDSDSDPSESAESSDGEEWRPRKKGKGPPSNRKASNKGSDKVEKSVGVPVCGYCGKMGHAQRFCRLFASEQGGGHAKGSKPGAGKQS